MVQKSRAPQTGKTVVKVKGKNNGSEFARLNVWVIWANTQIVNNSPILPQIGTITLGDGRANKPAFGQNGGYTFKFTIEPSTLFDLTKDVPDLRGAVTNNGNAVAVPGQGIHHVLFNDDLKGGANSKWDISRRIKVRIVNPARYTKDMLIQIPGTMWDKQPKIEDLPEAYPAEQPPDILIGNDDRSTEDERNDPYNANQDEGLVHGVGAITSKDFPNYFHANVTGSDGDTFEVHYAFGEFVRVLVGSNWYKCSQFRDWGINFKIKRVSGLWQNDGSTVTQDNSGF